MRTSSHRVYGTSNWILACLAHALLLVSGCRADPDSASVGAAEGRAELGLVAVQNGNTYRLHNAIVQIFGPTFAVLSSSEDPAETRLTMSLPIGAYQASLEPFWTLQKLSGAGEFEPVQAALSSSSVVTFDVLHSTTTRIAYEFQTDGSVIALGSGALNVEILVDEIPLACAPLGEGCPAGTWCAPVELVGAPARCVPSGGLAVGLPCRTPTSCGPNASCFDLGAGPVCAALCDASSFGQPCGGAGGTCRARGATFGVCE